MSAYRLDVENFICEVKKYPEIWDSSCEDSRHKNKKLRAWKEIAKVFIEDFDEMSELEKNGIYRRLSNKWRNIRDSYVRSIRKESMRGYIYASHLSFLNNIYKSGEDIDEETENNDWTSDADDPPKIKKCKTKPYDLFNDSNIWTSDHEDSSAVDDLKRKTTKKGVDIEYVDASYSNPPCTYPIEDEDRSFFESLLPAVRSFNLDQKLEFRSEVIGLIKKIRSINGQKIKLDPGTGDMTL